MTLLNMAFGVAALLLAVGVAGVVARRNFMFMLISIEVMFNAAALAFIAAGNHLAQPDGQIMFLLIITLAGAEAAVALGLILRIDRRFGTIDADAARILRG